MRSSCLLLLLLPLLACGPASAHPTAPPADLAVPPSDPAGLNLAAFDPVPTALALDGMQIRLVAPTPGDDNEFGYAVAGVGHVNTSAFGTVAIGCRQGDIAAANAGVVYLFHGSDLGMDTSHATTLTASDAFAQDRFGSAVVGLGDIDGDGYDDLAVGAPGNDDAGEGAGAVYVFLGALGGPVQSQKLSPAPAGGELGGGLSAAGDVDGDGQPDLAAGASGEDGSGAAYVWTDTGDGLELQSRLVADDPDEGDLFGHALGAGDLDGDGYDDLVVSAPNDDELATDAGAVYWFPGGAGGPSTADQRKLMARDGLAGDAFGYALTTAQLDEDGRADLAVGARLVDGVVQDQGAVSLFYGAAGGPQTADGVVLDAPDPLKSAFFGTALGNMGDVDGNGMDELAVGASGASSGGIASGVVYVFAGAEGGLDTTVQAKLAGVGLTGGERYGRSVAGAGDVNLDGVPDLVIGASDYVPDVGDGGTASASGAAFVLVPPCRDMDLDGACSADDCDDSDPFTFPGAGRLDSGDACVRDADGDGYGDASPGAGITAGTDCDDGDETVHPGAQEWCDGRDDDCSGAVDDNALDAGTWAPDADGDGWTADQAPVVACAAPADTFPPTFLPDCKDADPAVHPGAVEVVGDGVDQDCVGGDLVKAPKTKGCSTVGGGGGSASLAGLLLGLVGLLRRRRAER